jgi:hypothetical protein
VQDPGDGHGLERRKRILKALFDKYQRLKSEGRLEEAREHLRLTTLYANASMEETLLLARQILRRLEEIGGPLEAALAPKPNRAARGRRRGSH